MGEIAGRKDAYEKFESELEEETYIFSGFGTHINETGDQP